jgi:D-alanyl-D-alanine carboxypeptidase (penicillin-binding protein 5/6)
VRRAILIGLAVLGAASLTCARALAAPVPVLSVRAAALIEASTGQQLYGSSAQAQLPIASATKLMTALVTIEHARLDRVFTEPQYYPAAVDSQIGLVPGERMTVRDLLIGLLLPSGDDAAEDLAYNVGHGSVAAFVAMMNARARSLGLRHTHYSTPIGLDTPGNYSSALDLVALARYVLRTEPFIRRVVALPRAVLLSGSHRRVVENRNDLVGRVPWINGVKTGHTLDAGYVLVGSGTRNGMTLIGAVLGTSSESARDQNMLALLRWGFSEFHLVKPVVAGTVLARPSIRYRNGVHADVIAAATLIRVLPRSTHVSTQVEAPPELEGPLPWHARVGFVRVLANGRTIATIPLLLAHALPAVNPLTVASDFLTRPFTLLSVVVLVGIAAVLARRQRTRGRVRASASRR